MAQIYERKNQGLDWGRTLATGLSSGVQALLDHKMQKMQGERQADVLEKLGFPRELAFAPPHIQQQFAKTQLQAPATQQFANQIRNAQSGQPVDYTNLTERQISEAAKAEAAFKKAASVENKESIAFNKEGLESIKKGASASLKNIRDNELLIKLAKSGKLRAGAKNQLLTKLGLQHLGANVETQLADKLIARQAQNAAAAFNTKRLTNFEVGTYKDSIPGLKNTPEGIIAIAEVNILENEANIARDKARKEIIAENRGRVPFDILDQIEERAEPELARLGQEANNRVMQAMQSSGVDNQSGMEVGATFSSLDQANNYPIGTEVTDEDTGARFIRTKSGWEKA